MLKLDPESMGAYTGILGAFLLALNNDLSCIGWPLFLASNISWIVFSIRGKFNKLLLQQLAFTASSMIGIWNTYLSQTNLAIWLKTVSL